MLDVAGVLRGGLEEGDAEAVGELLFLVSALLIVCNAAAWPVLMPLPRRKGGAG